MMMMIVVLVVVEVMLLVCCCPAALAFRLTGLMYSVSFLKIYFSRI